MRQDQPQDDDHPGRRRRSRPGPADAGVFPGVLDSLSTLSDDLKRAKDELSTKEEDLDKFRARKKGLRKCAWPVFPPTPRRSPSNTTLMCEDCPRTSRNCRSPTRSNWPSPRRRRPEGPGRADSSAPGTFAARANGRRIVAMLEMFERTPVHAPHQDHPCETSRSGVGRPRRKRATCDELAVNLTIETLSMQKGGRREQPMLANETE